MSDLEEQLWNQITGDSGLPWPQREVKFCPKRRFRWDFAWEHMMLAVEVQGGSWLPNSQHGRGKKFESDCEKATLGAILGWRVMRFTADQIKDGRALALIQRALGEEI